MAGKAIGALERISGLMNPEVHLFASWVIGAKTTDNPRDCRLVALAGILPDLDGLGLWPGGVGL